MGSPITAHLTGHAGRSVPSAAMADHLIPIAVAPDSAPRWITDAVVAGGGTLVEPAQAEALVWGSPSARDELARTLVDAPGIRWVQLPWAGVEPYREVLDDRHLWTSGKGVYAEPVAEHALALALAGLRSLVGYGRADCWSDAAGTNLFDARVVILGGGGITEVLLGLLAPFRADVTVVRRTPAPMDGARAVVGPDELHDVLAGADLLVLALALTPATVGIIGAAELALLAAHAWLVNVARGAHVVTADLVVALRDGTIGGAALDVTDPEPLPADHPLWLSPRCLITPHVGSTPAMARPLLSRRITENVRRYAAGEPLLGPVDPVAGY
ncbi:D-isomer specific 2-hydroxyacid dehydrogenase family protein [soil metagenome]